LKIKKEIGDMVKEMKVNLYSENFINFKILLLS